MMANTDNCYINSKLTMYDNSDSPLTVLAIAISLTTQNDTISECHLSFQVNPQLYKHIDTEALFNLRPEIRSPFSDRAFQPSPDIQIEASLNPAVLSQLAEHATDANQAATYLQQISREQPNHPILSTYSWYALEVKQQKETGETGYRTLWAYLKPSFIKENGIDSEKLNEAMANFAKEWANTNVSDNPQTSVSGAAEEINKTFDDLTNHVSEMTQEVFSETIQEMTQVFEELTEEFSEVIQEVDTSILIYDALIDFFKTESWSFQTLPNQTMLRLAFKGKQFQWDCYAKAREEQQQYIFYSICPIQAPEPKHPAIAEFLTRANYGMILGNFELDYSDGEIRYKTSIDVEGDTLTPALIRNLVYTNVTMMDRYLPGILAILEQGATPVQAIRLVEQNEPIL